MTLKQYPSEEELMKLNNSFCADAMLFFRQRLYLEKVHNKMPLEDYEKVYNPDEIFEKNKRVYKNILITTARIENINKLNESHEIAQNTNTLAEMLPPTKTYKEIIENKYHIKK
jgi:hypothetical protein